jgi:hypothetical protein
VSSQGFTYVIRTQDKTHYKIGWTQRHPSERLSELQSSHSQRLVLEGCIPSSPELEDQLHDHFHDSHVRGEWFDLDPSDVHRILDREWRRQSLNKTLPWERAGVCTEEDWEQWADAGFPEQGWDDPIIPDD